VACAGAFLLAFALAMVYTAGVMLANANNKLAEERCYQLAKSFAGVVREELEKPVTDSEFCSFANKFLDEPAYNEYNPDRPETVYHYMLQTGEDENYGKVALQLYKVINEDGVTTPLEGSIELPVAGGEMNYTEKIRNLKDTKFQRYLLTVEVTATQDKLTYDYATEYYREDQYPVIFRYGEQVIVWNETENKWKKNDTAGPDCAFDSGLDMQITYTYDTKNPVSTRFIPVHEEGGASS